MDEINRKMNLINKYLDNKNIILDISLINYETYNIYIRIAYNKKYQICNIYWIDLDLINDKKIKKYINKENISYKEMEEIFNSFEENPISTFSNIKNKNTIIINAYLENSYHYEFNKYIPQKFYNVASAMRLIFNNLPRKLEMFLYEMHADITNTKMNYDYNDVIKFDLFNDNLNVIASEKIIKKLNTSQKEILFLEKIENKYFSIVVKDKNKYLIIINYNKEKNETSLYCTCPCQFFCKHILSVIEAIRSKYESPFYRVIYSNTTNILESALISKYILATGIEDEYLEIINKYGEIEQVPLLDENNNLNFKILKDGSNNELYKEFKKTIKKATHKAADS